MGRSLCHYADIVHGKEFQITTNLESALQHIRLPDHAQLLWVDAICINQNGVAERRSQVMHMASIYKSATEVICWLGEADEDSVYMFRLYQIMTRLLVHGELPDWEFELLHELMDHPRKDRKIEATSIERSWFSRLWTVQEMLLATSVVFRCGSDCLSGQEMADCTSENASGVGLYSGISPHLIKAQLWLAHAYEGKSSLRAILEFFGRQQCSDPRDCIYGCFRGCPLAQYYTCA
jgi:hypothetical protein